MSKRKEGSRFDLNNPRRYWAGLYECCEALVDSSRGIIDRLDEEEEKNIVEFLNWRLSHWVAHSISEAKLFEDSIRNMIAGALRFHAVALTKRPKPEPPRSCETCRYNGFVAEQEYIPWCFAKHGINVNAVYCSDWTKKKKGNDPCSE